MKFFYILFVGLFVGNALPSPVQGEAFGSKASVPVQAMPMPMFPILAQTTAISFDGALDKFLVILGRICLVLCLLMVVWAAHHIHQQRVMESVYCLVGAFILAIAVPIARAVMRLGDWGL